MKEREDSRLPVKNIDNKMIKLVEEVYKEENVDKIKDLTALFNLNIQKKNLARMFKLHALLDTVSDKVAERIEKRPDEITNKELIDFMTATQNILDKTGKSVENIDENLLVQINQQKNEVNINIGDKLNRESKKKVMDAIEAIFKPDSQVEVITPDEDIILDTTAEEEYE